MKNEDFNLHTSIRLLANRVERLEREFAVMRSGRVAPQPVVNAPTASIEFEKQHIESVLAPPQASGGPNHGLQREVPTAVAGPQSQNDASAEKAVHEISEIQPVRGGDEAGNGRAKLHSIGAFESIVGGRWYAIAGAAIVVVGIAIFLTVAVQRGWVVLTPSLRCTVAAVFGVALIGVGERLRVKINVAASLGLFAAGISCLYASVHVAHSMYALLTGGIATVLLSLVTVVGVFVAVRAASALIGALTVGLAFVTPLLTFGDSEVPAGVPMYLLALLALGQILGVLRPGVFSWAMRAGWIGTSIVGGVWIARSGVQNAVLALLFLGCAWFGLQAGFWVRARRAIREGESEEFASALDVRLWGDGSVSFVASCWAMLGSYYVTHWSHVMHESLPAFALTAAALMVALTLAGHLQLFVATPMKASERLGVSLLWQAGSALVAGLALALPTSLVSISWLGLAVGAINSGGRLRSRGLFVYGIGLLLLTSGRILSIDALTAGLRTEVVVAGLHLSLWNTVAAAAGFGWFVGTRAGTELKKGWRDAAYAFASAGAVFLLIACCNRASDMRSMAAVSAALCVGIGMAGPVLRGLRVEWIGLGGLLVPIGLWIASYTSMAAQSVNTHLNLIVGLLIVAAIFILRGRIVSGLTTGRLLLAVVGLLVALGASSMEVANVSTLVLHEIAVRRAAVSVWWGLFAVGLIVAGFALAKKKHESAHAIRVGGLALLGAAAIKAVLFDLGSASALSRAASLIGVGLLMIGVAVAYSKAKRGLLSLQE